MTWCVAIHGGAGDIEKGGLDAETEAGVRHALEAVISAASEALARGAQADDVATEAVVALEESPFFNAGRGAVLNDVGEVELDAALMRGSDRAAGAVAGVRRTRNPIRLAQRVRDASPHLLLIGEAADAFGEKLGLEAVDPSWFLTASRVAQQKRLAESGTITLDHGGGGGTVGCVCRDLAGEVVAATSTGGMANQWAGRVGDTPIIGAGTYAVGGIGAVSATGDGEIFIRAVAASRVLTLVEHAGCTLDDACVRVLRDVERLGGTGGLIAVGAEGPAAVPYTTAGMYRARAWEGDPAAQVAIWED